MSKRKNPLAKIGDKYNRWTVIGEPTKNSIGQLCYLCRCECGNERNKEFSAIYSGHSKSCGCLRNENTARRNTKHGAAQRGAMTRLYKEWRSMRNRCKYESMDDYYLYGGRGIKVCDEWQSDFAAFRNWALWNGYDDLLVLDRIDTNGNYEPSNCRWVTLAENGQNKRNNRLITAFGETKCMSAWGSDQRCKIKTTALQHRLNTGWGPEEAITALHYAKRGCGG